MISILGNKKFLRLSHNSLQIPAVMALLVVTSCATQDVAFKETINWKIDTQEEWLAEVSTLSELNIKDGLVSSDKQSIIIKSGLKQFDVMKSAASITVSQSPTWDNWEPVENLGPSNIDDAPIFLKRAPGDYWVFARIEGHKRGLYVATGDQVQVQGFDYPLYETKFENQYDAPGALNQSLGGYHAWQSRDMKTWIHHGSVSDTEAKWMTSAEQVGSKTYLYYDFPNDQDPHLIIDDDLFDGEMGTKMGMAFNDPSNGSDSAIIRDLEGKFHLILEDWSPINARERSWDSPLASHAVSDDGISNFKLVSPAVDYRTTPTGEMKQHVHPGWHKEDPENYSATATNPRSGAPVATAEYELHTPEQDAFGDWAAIAIGDQYYLFGDYDRAGLHGRENMKIGIFTSSDIYEPFSLIGAVGQGHPDPDIMFAEGKFYLISQTDDFVSPGPWVDGVDIRVGVDIDNDQIIDHWSEWSTVKETYDHIDGFSKQVKRHPARADLSSLPAGYGFSFEIRLSTPTASIAKPTLDWLQIDFVE